MRIGMVHNYYQIAGGEDESFRSEVQMLQDAGHEVVTYTEHNDRVAELGPLRTGARTVWSVGAYRRVRGMLRKHRCEVLHVQNFFPLLSPSVYYAAYDEGVPVVQTLRNYRLMCSNALFFRDGHVCEDCMCKTPPWPGIVHACYRDSRAGSAAVVTMLTAHRGLRTWRNKVNVYVALTEFAKSKLIHAGLPSEKIVVKPNFVHPDPGVGEHRGDYVLFVGRLSAEKGVRTLLRAWKHVGNRATLRIVGDGPLRHEVVEAAQRQGGVEYLGRRSVEEVYDLMGAAKLLVFPSEWYETFGRVAVEAFAKGTPVVAANLGAVAEVVRDGHTGLLFTPGDASDLATKVTWALDHAEERTRMGCAARYEYQTKYTTQTNLDMLLGIYKLVLTLDTDARAHQRS